VAFGGVVIMAFPQVLGGDPVTPTAGKAGTGTEGSRLLGYITGAAGFTFAAIDSEDRRHVSQKTS